MTHCPAPCAIEYRLRPAKKVKSNGLTVRAGAHEEIAAFHLGFRDVNSRKQHGMAM